MLNRDCKDNPVKFVDPSGLIIEIAKFEQQEPKREDYKNDRQYYEAKKLYDNAKNEYDNNVEEYNRAIEYLKTSEKGAALIERLESAEEVFTIEFITNMNSEYDYTTRKIFWDATGGVRMSDGTSVMSPTIVLAHEMGHGAQHLDGLIKSDETYYHKERLFIEENNLADYEIPIALQLGEPTRDSYDSHKGVIRMNNSTHYRTTHRYPWGNKKYTINHGQFWIGTTIGQR